MIVNPKFIVYLGLGIAALLAIGFALGVAGLIQDEIKRREYWRKNCPK